MSRDASKKSLVLVPKDKGGNIKIVPGRAPVTVGSAKDCDFRIGSPAIAPKHIEVSLLGDLVVAKDLSGGSFYINNERARQGYIYEGDIVRLGKFELVAKKMSATEILKSVVHKEEDPTPTDPGVTDKISRMCKVPLGGLEEDSEPTTSVWGDKDIVIPPPSPDFFPLHFAINDEAFHNDNKNQHLLFNSLVVFASVLDLYKNYCFNHSEQVMQYSMLLAKAIKLSPSDTVVLGIASLLHDIGKFKICDLIWQKREPLSKKEWEAIKKHPVFGEEIMLRVGGAERIARAIRHHHERVDGTGYPDGLRGGKIPLISRIITIADSFESMTSPRPWRGKPLSRKQAAEELDKGRGKQFDPMLTEAFIKILKKQKMNLKLVIEKKKRTSNKE